MRRSTLLVVALLPLLAIAASPSASAPGGSTAATRVVDDEPDLRNFEHVFHFAFPGGDPAGQGTDIDFYTPTVARRGPDTKQKVLDGEGREILEQRDFAVVGSYDRGAFIFDITDPERTSFVTHIACKQRQNNPEIRRFGDQWVLALTRDGNSGNPCAKPVKGEGGAGVALFDITDPYEVQALYSFRTKGGAHNFTWHPTKPFGWVSPGLAAIPGHIPIIDFTNLNNPKLAADILVEGAPHDVSFNADGSRAYVGAITLGHIFDTNAPAAPVSLARFPAPGYSFHSGDATPDGRTLLVPDENAPISGYYVPGGGACPGGGFTLFDITGANERTPLPVGYGQADMWERTRDRRECTAHVGRITANSRYYVTGWYLAGVRVFDLSDRTRPVDIGHAMMPASEVWAAKFHKGDYVYTGDLGRGFDVYRWTGPTFGNPPVTVPPAR